MQEQHKPFWCRFLTDTGRDPATPCYESFHFGDNCEDATELARLALGGSKHATAGLLWLNQSQGLPLPQPGSLSVLTWFDGTPVAVIETIQVEVVPFEEVSAEFAAAEGEGDLSLTQWRKSHWSFFSTICRHIGRTPSLRMPVICEYFAVIHR
ncbi:ASCH domain-containing protein [Chitiniphilus purpureus]|uniref:ASCH domain-containing protein n=1 Tax=Chitiniphilus purpureus TaxID=2981137 RepID=A0ABY6DMQ1_9NEIS|nr:ASCH domain-containing protein [Chitiniphilus sp. CD1]UXY14376.1 ASCH domain-containing protein [Chitiniphilus sp. CD1]